MIAIVLTTINIPTVLEEYINNCKEYGHEDVIFIVVGDMKSPAETGAYLASLEGEVIYLDIGMQNDFLKKFPELGEFLPYNSVERRNIGYLYAGTIGADIIISIDDDCYPLPEYDYIGRHSIVGQTLNCDITSTTWFNPCDLLESKPSNRFYHRGFPNSKRDLPRERRRVVVNAGLWLGDPDIDTVTRIEGGIVVTGLKEERVTVIGKGIMAPFNSQNTAFSIDLLPCMYLIAFRDSVAPVGDNSFRYDDIWMSYFAKVVIDHMGDAIAFGLPCVRQERNRHDYSHDLKREHEPMLITDILADILLEIRLTERTYLGAYQELTEYIDSRIVCDSRFDLNQQAFLGQMTEGMRLWLEAVGKVR